MNANEQLDGPETACVVSVMKSGTHWMRFLLANYLHLMNGGDPNAGVTYEDLQSRYSPNDRRRVLRGDAAVVKSPLFPVFGTTDLLWQHVDKNLASYQGTVIFLFRNPLDVVVSRYFYDRDNWNAEGLACSSPADSISWSVKWYAESLVAMRNLHPPAVRRMISVAYEDLAQSPATVLGIVVRSLGWPENRDRIMGAVNLSSRERIRRLEDDRGAPLLGSASLNHFVRDGSVGQWRKYLNEEDVSRVDSILREHGMLLGNFNLGEV